jgi:hypothetical protein
MVSTAYARQTAAAGKSGLASSVRLLLVTCFLAVVWLPSLCHAKEAGMNLVSRRNLLSRPSKLRNDARKKLVRFKCSVVYDQYIVIQ